MTYTMTVSPDFSPDHIAGWFIFNTWLQKQTNESIHLELYDSFDRQRRDIEAGIIDLIYANPYDASMLIRDKGFVAIAAPLNKPDEVTICVKNDSLCKTVEDLQESCNIATTNDPEVNTIGMIMLEPANLSAKNIRITEYQNYVIVAKNLINKKAEAGFFLKETYDNMSGYTKSQIRPIVTSQISVIKHMFLVDPNFIKNSSFDEYAMRKLLNEMHTNSKGISTLKSLGFEKWVIQNKEDAEFMIDLMDALIA
ncbi:MAG: phosphate/phosphite/phosphonate ABC transporter substrate-binding protein [Proteobacteria bacterium]|nr:phosphate/phosphite/phosphonate ABC transporter substrate-binding protein [Pseudomonadota bacterium]